MYVYATATTSLAWILHHRLCRCDALASRVGPAVWYALANLFRVRHALCLFTRKGPCHCYQFHIGNEFVVIKISLFDHSLGVVQADRIAKFSHERLNFFGIDVPRSVFVYRSKHIDHSLLHVCVGLQLLKSAV